MNSANEFLTIGDAARRSGVATSALRFYESRGLISSRRVSGNHRRYHRATLRRIADLQNLRDRLGGCIGCGCLSLTHCSLYNTGDEAADLGSGPRYLLGDVPQDKPA